MLLIVEIHLKRLLLTLGAMAMWGETLRNAPHINLFAPFAIALVRRLYFIL